MVNPTTQTTTLRLPVNAHRVLQKYAYDRRIQARPPKILQSIFMKNGIYVAGWQYDLAGQDHTTIKITTTLFSYLQKVQRLLNVYPYNLSVMDIVVGNLIILTSTTTIGISGQMIARTSNVSTVVTRDQKMLHYCITLDKQTWTIPTPNSPTYVDFEIN